MIFIISTDIMNDMIDVLIYFLQLSSFNCINKIWYKYL